MKRSILKYCTLSSLLLANISYGASYKSTPETKQLEQIQKVFTKIAKEAIPCVVFIKTEIQRKPTSFMDSPQPFDFFADEFFRRFFGDMQRNSQSTSPQQGSGSGFFVKDDGYILTNNHVIHGATKILVILNDGREYEAEVVGTDPKTDLAVIKIEEKGLPYLSFGNSDDLDIAEWVTAIGNPFALESSLTVGVVSAKGRQDLGITTLEDFIQTDAAVNPGNSGGPLLNLSGDVIGVNTAIATKSGGNMGISFAIPSKLAEYVMHQLIKSGEVKRAYLGIVLQTIDKELAEALNLKRGKGILVTEVSKNSPASKAGLESGDIILSLNGEKVNNMNRFRNEIAMMDPGTTVKLNVQRKDKELKFKVKLEVLAEKEVASQGLFDKLGLDIDDLHNLPSEALNKVGLANTSEGVIITKVEPGSPAAIAGIRPYQMITGVVVDWKNQKKVSSLSEFNEAIKEVGSKKYVVLIVRHQNYQRYYTIKLP